MNKKHLAFIAFFFYIITFSANLYAQEDEKKKDYLAMRITPEISLYNGTINEYVFSASCFNTDNKLSELVWDLKNVPVFTLTADFDILEKVYAGITGRIGLPYKSGHMQDYDWLNSTTTIWKSDSPYEITNYSCHDNSIYKMMQFTIRLGWNFYLPFDIKLSPYAAYQYDFLGFSASDGYSIYKSNKYQTGTFSGKVISYNHELNSIMTGVKVIVNTVPRTTIESDFCFSPALTFLNANDYHYKNTTAGYGTAYWDKLDFAWLIQAHLAVQYKFNKNHSSGISGGIEFIPLKRGITSSKSLGSNGLPAYGKWNQASTETGGAKRLMWNISINYSFSL